MVAFSDIHEVTGPGTELFLPCDVSHHSGGLVVGSVDGAVAILNSASAIRRATTWSVGGGGRFLDVPGAVDSVAIAVTELGDIVGIHRGPGTSSGVAPRHGFYSSRGGPPVDLGPLLGTPVSFASDINIDGRIVGGAGSGADPCDYELFVYDVASGQVTMNLGNVCLQSDRYAYRNPVGSSGPFINDAGQIVGLHSFRTVGYQRRYQLGLYESGTVSILGEVERLHDINNDGIVVGSRSYSSNSSTTSFVGDKSGLHGFSHLGYAYDLNAANPHFEVGMPLHVAGPSRDAQASGIDDYGNIVGDTTWDTDGVSKPDNQWLRSGGHLYSRSFGMIMLDDLLPGLPSGAGWLIGDAVRISVPAGSGYGAHVVGTGLHHGRTCAFLLAGYWSAA